MQVQSCCFASIKLIAFLPLSLPSLSSLLNLHIVVVQKFCYHGNVTSFYFSLLTFCFLWLTATNSPEAMMDSDDDYNFDSDFSWWEPLLTWRATWCWICSRLDFKMISWLSVSITFFILIDRENVFLYKAKATLRPEEVAWNIVKLMVVAWENSRHFATPLLVSPRSGVWWTSAVNRVWNFCALFSDAISQGNECWRREMLAWLLIGLLYVSVWTDVVAS